MLIIVLSVFLLKDPVDIYRTIVSDAVPEFMYQHELIDSKEEVLPDYRMFKACPMCSEQVSLTMTIELELNNLIIAHY